MLSARGEPPLTAGAQRTLLAVGSTAKFGGRLKLTGCSVEPLPNRKTVGQAKPNRHCSIQMPTTTPW